MRNKSTKDANDRLLTDLELEMMNAIWHLGQATVKDVITHLAKEKKLAYTTVATVLKILEQKGFLDCHKDTYAHVFVPRIAKSTYESTCISHVVEHVFDGESVALVQRLLDAKKLSKEEIKAIEAALKKLAPTGGKKI